MRILLFCISLLILSVSASANVTYTVKRGDNLRKIANRYGIGLRELIRINSLQKPYIIKVGQKLRIPVKESRRLSRNYVFYRVKRGDTLIKIAKRFNTSARKLITLNHLKRPYIIKVGQRLKVPSIHRYSKVIRTKRREKSFETSVRNVYTSSLISKVPVYKYYRVRRGDSVIKIAKKFHVSPRMIIRENRLKRPYIIRTRQRLKILIGYRNLLSLNRPIQFRFPLDGRVDPTVRKEGYPGIFILSPPGAPVKAAETGIVKFSGKNEHFLKAYGKTVVIEHPKNYQTIYSNLDKIFVKPKQIVKRGSIIGTAGSSGDWRKTGIYFEISKVYHGKIYQINPLEVLK